ncbi:hypothetical protein L1987_17493 [Smallanthus sonchifolius]|uniref:Uncharacterized protein n=1 Tax=Smallanthus sonchifolius TaxID=185202 RepID=A0ACB9IY42_9ASTR|nr:hypothetical protein L1987_17493 [Smallanthus sonchifolius]
MMPHQHPKQIRFSHMANGSSVCTKGRPEDSKDRCSTLASNVYSLGVLLFENFVGLSVADGYIACGSETNEVFAYYRSLPMPITSHKFGSIDPISDGLTKVLTFPPLQDKNDLAIDDATSAPKSNQIYVSMVTMGQNDLAIDDATSARKSYQAKHSVIVVSGGVG